MCCSPLLAPHAAGVTSMHDTQVYALLHPRPPAQLQLLQQCLSKGEPRKENTC